jgi:hypothetical protein
MPRKDAHVARNVGVFSPSREGKTVDQPIANSVTVAVPVVAYWG